MNKMVDYSSLFELDRGSQPKKRGFKWLLAILIPVMALVGFLSYRLLPGFLAAGAAGATPTPTTLPTRPPVSTPTATSIPTPTNTSIPSPTQTASIFGCTAWAQVSLADVGKDTCVQGEYLREFEREDGTQVMVFSEDPGKFQIWTGGKPFDWYLKGATTKCVLAHGWIMTSGVRPIIILGQGSRLEPCP